MRNLDKMIKEVLENMKLHHGDKVIIKGVCIESDFPNSKKHLIKFGDHSQIWLEEKLIEKE